MAINRQRTCDACGQPAVIVLKLYVTPVKEGESLDHSSYTGHMDVGECCADKALNLGKWQKRRAYKRRTKGKVKK